MKKLGLKELRSLSFAQPWAECIVSKGKNIEIEVGTLESGGILPFMLQALIHLFGLSIAMKITESR